MAEALKSVEEATVLAWNTWNPVGTPVVFITDDGKQCPTKTRSEAYLIAGGRKASGSLPVIFIDAKTGCVLLSRLVPWHPDPDRQ